MDFKLTSKYKPTGDQPQAIEQLTNGVLRGDPAQVLLGVTGSGKTFTVANVIANVNKPTLVLSHNKTLAAQLYEEMKGFFPDNAVDYYVSYYDYYQPEAYLPTTDVYIEKDLAINDEIDKLRLGAVSDLLSGRNDVVVVSSVSCIYGMGGPVAMKESVISIKRGQRLRRDEFLHRLVAALYTRNDIDFTRGTFRVRGDVIELWPAHLEDRGWRIGLFGDEIESIVEFDPLTGKKISDLKFVKVYANSHYVTPRPTLNQATHGIKAELKETLDWMVENGKLLEAQRLEQRVRFDLEMIEALRDAVDVPLVASGGAGTPDNFVQAARAGADAVLAASIFHFGQHTIPEAKAYLAAQGIEMRL